MSNETSFEQELILRYLKKNKDKVVYQYHATTPPCYFTIIVEKASLIHDLLTKIYRENRSSYDFGIVSGLFDSDVCLDLYHADLGEEETRHYNEPSLSDNMNCFYFHAYGYVSTEDYQVL